jgi:hypothetical protein
VTGSTVLPHRYAAKLDPGISSTRVALPSRCNAAMASVQYDGMSLGRSTLSDKYPVRHTGVSAANASAPTTTLATTSSRRDRKPPIAAASNAARPSTTMGTTRGVLRRASIGDQSFATVFHTRPYGVGSS